MNRQLGLLLGLLLAFSASSGGQTIPDEKVVIRATEIRENPVRFLRSSVTVEGFVTQYVDEAGSTAAFFYLKDYWGGLLRVQTRGQPPAVGQAYRVTGRVVLDPAISDAYLVEVARAAVVATPTSSAPATVEPAESRIDMGWVAIAISAGLAGVVLAFVGWFFLNQRSAAQDPGVAAAVHESPVRAELPFIEGQTVRLAAPPQGTVKILPGWFEVLGEEGAARQILLFQPKNQPAGDITFGRTTGPAFSHIQLKPATVSIHQAMVRHDNGQVLLTNLAPASSNPTRVNQNALGMNQAVPLQNQDLVEMGEVRLRFHRS